MAYEINVQQETSHPDVAIGIKLPIVNTTNQMFPLSYSTFEQSISNLKNLILTNRGERLYQPIFGTDIRRFLFEPDTELLYKSIRDDITESVNFWLPYITIDKLTVQQVLVGPGNATDEHGISISLLISVNKQKSNTPITFLITSNSIEELYATT